MQKKMPPLRVADRVKWFGNNKSDIPL